MTDTQTVCCTIILIAAILWRCWYRLMSILDRAVDEFDLDEVNVTGRTVNIKAKK